MNNIYLPLLLGIFLILVKHIRVLRKSAPALLCPFLHISFPTLPCSDLFFHIFPVLALPSPASPSPFLSFCSAFLCLCLWLWLCLSLSLSPRSPKNKFILKILRFCLVSNWISFHRNIKSDMLLKTFSFLLQWGHTCTRKAAPSSVCRSHTQGNCIVLKIERVRTYNQMSKFLHYIFGLKIL